MRTKKKIEITVYADREVYINGNRADKIHELTILNIIEELTNNPIRSAYVRNFKLKEVK